MAINFPDSPTLNQIVYLGNSSYIWNGSAWVGYSTSVVVNYNASSVVVQDSGVVSGASTTINFGDNLTVTYNSGIATITGAAGAGIGGTATNIDITNTNGLTTIYYPTFVENRTTGQTLRADVDLSYRTDTNILTVGGGVSIAGGTSTQFLKANGTLDSSTYLTSYTETDTLNSVTGRGNTTSNGISVGVLTATQFIRSGGTSSQFLKADGSVDSNTYLTTTGSAANLTGLTGASSGTYGSSTAVPVVTVNANGRITGISTSAVTVGLSSLPSRTNTSTSTSIIGVGVSENITLNGFKSYALHKIGVSTAAWVVLYCDTASRTADASRNQTTDPSPGSGVIAEVVTGINTVVLITPSIVGWNNDTTPSGNIYAKVTNLGSSSQAITVGLDLVKLED